MKEVVKDKIIALRVTEEEKKLVEESAQKNGFHSVAQFILWLIKKYGRS